MLTCMSLYPHTAYSQSSVLKLKFHYFLCMQEIGIHATEICDRNEYIIICAYSKENENSDY